MTAWLLVLWFGGHPGATDCWNRGCSVTTHSITGQNAGIRCNAALTEIVKVSEGRVHGVCVKA